MEVGERWAHRVAPFHGPVSEVEVLKLGSQRPRRVKVRFVAEEAEGHEEWIPPARLRVPWEQKDAWLERQRCWDDLTRDGPDDEAPEFCAASLVFDECPLEDLVSLGWNYRERGVLYIHDPRALAVLLQVPEDTFQADPRAFTDDDGTLHAPWPTTLTIAPQIAKIHAEKLLDSLARQEARTQQRAIYGEFHRGRGKNPGMYIEPEICAQVDREAQPGRDLVREWCGAEATARRDELTALRTEVARIGKLTEQAITTLREAGQRSAADRLERELGVPLDVLRHAPSTGT